MLFRSNTVSASRPAGTMPQKPASGQQPTGEASVGALLEQMIEEVPTVFGRLAYLAALYDPHTGAYRHPILNQLLPAGNVDRLLRMAHWRVFGRWVEFTLRQQQGDLTRYLGYGSLGPELLRQLRDRDAFRTLPPLDAAAHERALFSHDLAALLNSVLID
jgi:hypothetical protein